MSYYARSKLCVNTVASSLQRQVNNRPGLNAVVHTMCPGPVASEIARDAPWFARPVVDLIFKLVFQTPATASIPVRLFSPLPALLVPLSSWQL